MGIGAELLRETRRQRERLEPYNDETVRQTLSAIENAWNEASGWAAAQSAADAHSLLDAQNHARLVAVQHMVRHGQRAVCAYLLMRLRIVANVAAASPSLPVAVRECLSGAEAAFADEYASALKDFGRSAWAGAGLLDVGVTARPPRTLYVQIRVLADCGVIETENGQLHLARNTMHYVRRTDVQALIDQGHVAVAH